MNSLPLVIDLDGTLIHTDLLLESSLNFIRTHPLRSVHPLIWMMRGKAYLKTRFAQQAAIDVTCLPYNPQVLALIQEARAAGRTVVLATASHKVYADQIAAHLKVFDRVLATEHSTNLSAYNKRDRLIAEYGEGGFDYCGNARADLPIWAAARHAYLVNPQSGIETRAKAHGNVQCVMTSPRHPLQSWIKSLRLHQWMKNLLLFVPLLASHRLNEMDLLLKGMLAFILFGLCASSVYILNDLLDLEHDRHHATKRYRPFASGHLSIVNGLVAFPPLLAASFAGAMLYLPQPFTTTLAFYYILTLAYSIVLKRRMVVDIITLALLYTLRMIAGAFALQIALTYWMLVFSMFIFLSLALLKRYAELKEARTKNRIAPIWGRGYIPDDLEIIAALGAASGYLSVMVLALYWTQILEFPCSS